MTSDLVQANNRILDAMGDSIFCRSIGYVCTSVPLKLSLERVDDPVMAVRVGRPTLFFRIKGKIFYKFRVQVLRIKENYVCVRFQVSTHHGILLHKQLVNYRYRIFDVDINKNVDISINKNSLSRRIN